MHMKTLTQSIILAALISLTVTLLSCVSSHVGPEEEEYATTRSGLPEPYQPATAPPLILGPEDVLNVEIWRQDDINREVTADRQGNIHLPLIGRLNIAGQNLDWVRFTLADRFEKYYNEPDVLVSLKESPLQKAFVLGEVAQPGSYKITGTTTVLELITEAGGFSDDADKGAVVLIRGHIDTPRIIPLDLEAALNGDLRSDWYLLRGDIVYVNRTLIADIEQFARRITNIITAPYLFERSLIIGAAVPDAVLHGDVTTRISID